MERPTPTPFSSPRPAGRHIHPGSCNQHLPFSLAPRGPTQTTKIYRRVPWLFKPNQKYVFVNDSFLKITEPTGHSPRRFTSSLIATCLLILVLAIPSQAQQTNISGNGLGTVADPLVNNEVKIYGGERPGGGATLYHSFGEFSIGAGDTAMFQHDAAGSAAPATSNILARITGGNVSNIFGTVDTATNFGNAALFLMNTAGFIFGETAVLNVGGAFTAVTADNIQMTDAMNTQFDANSVAGNLVDANVASFGFLNQAPPVIAMGSNSAIEIRGLNTQGSSVTFVGRDAQAGAGGPIVEGVEVNGTITSQGGDVVIASLASSGQAIPGSISFEGVAQQGQTTISGDINSAGGKVEIEGGQINIPGNITTNGGSVLIAEDTIAGGQTDISGNITTEEGSVTIGQEAVQEGEVYLTGEINTEGPDFGGGGDVAIYGRTITTRGGKILAPSREDGFFSGMITLKARGTVSILEDSLITNSSGFFSFGTQGISIEAQQDIIVDSSNIESENIFSFFAGGDVSIRAGGDVVLNGGQSNMGAQVGRITTTGAGFAGADGAIGKISIEGTNISATGKFFISSGTSGSQNSGDVSLTAQQNVNFSGEAVASTTTSGEGNGGKLTVLTKNANFSGGGALESGSGNFATGAAGEIDVTASGETTISGTNPNGNRPSGFLVSANGQGPAGTILVKTGKFTATNGAGLRSTNVNGAGGSITVQGINGGPGPDINFSNGAFANAKSTGTADAGDLNFTGSNFSATNALFETETTDPLANGGNMKFTVPSSGNIFFNNTRLSAKVAGGTGGNINLDPGFIILKASTIVASASIGSGGTISLTATHGIFLDQFSILNASAGPAGIDGEVNVSAPIQNLNGVISPLTQKIVSPATLYAERCAAQKDGKFNSFVQGGRDGFPPAPGGFLPSPLLLPGPGSASSGMGTGEIQNLEFTMARLGLEKVQIGTTQGCAI